MTGSHVLLLTGPPGIGKTTAIRRVAEGLTGQKIGGFTTEEIREKGQRVGFGLESFLGASAVLAHVGIAFPHRVSRYGVDLGALDRFVELTLDPTAGPDVFLVDEIGKMECLSQRFVAVVEGRVPPRFAFPCPHRPRVEQACSVAARRSLATAGSR